MPKVRRVSVRVRDRETGKIRTVHVEAVNLREAKEIAKIGRAHV